MWSYELDPRAVILAQLFVESLLVVLVGLLLWRRPKAPKESPEMKGAMAATENLLRRLEEKRKALETAVEAVRDKDAAPAPVVRRAEPRPPEPAPRPGLERAASLAARGLSATEIARQLGVPRAEVEMYLSLREDRA